MDGNNKINPEARYPMRHRKRGKKIAYIMQVFGCEMLIITRNLGPARVNPTAGPRSNGKNS